jgi:excisionase family DNA binding protein
MKREAEHRNQDYTDTMSVARLARRWHLTRTEVRHMLGRGVLSFVQIRGKLRVPREEIERYEKSCHETSCHSEPLDSLCAE